MPNESLIVFYGFLDTNPLCKKLEEEFKVKKHTK